MEIMGLVGILTFGVQLLLCANTKRRWLLRIPVVLAAIASLYCVLLGIGVFGVMQIIEINRIIAVLMFGWFPFPMLLSIAAAWLLYKICCRISLFLGSEE